MAKYFKYTTGKKRTYDDCFYEFLDALIHFSNTKYMKYELDFNDPSEKAVEMFRERFGYIGESADIRKSEDYKKLMMRLNSCRRHCNRVVAELKEWLADTEAISDQDCRIIIDSLSFTPKGLSVEDKYNVRIEERSPYINTEYIKRIQKASYFFQEKRKIVEKVSMKQLCNFCVGEDIIESCQTRIEAREKEIKHHQSEIKKLRAKNEEDKNKILEMQKKLNSLS